MGTLNTSGQISSDDQGSLTALPAAAPAGGTGDAAGAYDTAAHRDELIVTVNDLRTIVGEMRAALLAAGLMKSA